MKKITRNNVLTLVAAFATCFSAAATENVFDFKTNPNGWDSATAAERFEDETKGNVPEEGYTVGDVTMTATTGTYIRTGSYLLVDYDGTVTFTAAEGKKITKVTFESSKMNFTTTQGELTDLTWTGDANAVSFVSTNNRTYVAVATVTTEDGQGAETEWVECANIAAFKALERGTMAHLALNDAHVNGADQWLDVAYLEDATGAIMLDKLGLGLATNDKLNGYIYVARGYEDIYDDSVEGEGPDGELVKAMKCEDTTADELQVEHDVTMAAATLDAAMLDFNNLSRLVKVENILVEKPSRFYLVTIGEKQVRLQDYFFLGLTIPENETVASATGVLAWDGVRYNIYLTDIQTDISAITELDANKAAADDNVYTITGICLGKVSLSNVPAGIYIKNGHKVIVK